VKVLFLALFTLGKMKNQLIHHYLVGTTKTWIPEILIYKKRGRKEYF
jgi:hypothetical protein